MKRTMIFLMAWLLTLGMTAQNYVNLLSAAGDAGEEVTVSISMDNADAVSAIELNIPLNELLEFVPGSASVGSRCQNHTVTAGVKDGKLNVIIYSLTMASISGNSGEVASFKLKLGNQPTSVYLSPSSVTLTNAAGGEVAGYANGNYITIYCPKAEYSTMAVDFGRVAVNRTATEQVTIYNRGNKDLTVTGFTLSDYVTFTTEAQLPMTIAPYMSESFTIKATPQQRGKIQKTIRVDCNSISKLNTISLNVQAFTVNELHVGDASGVADTEVTIPLSVNNEDAISGFQFEFDLPEQLTYVDGSFVLSDRKTNHAVATSINGQHLKAIAYSGSGSAFTGSDGVIASFKVKLSGRESVMLTPSKAILTAMINGSAENVASDVYGGQISINSPRLSTESTINFGRVPVTQDCKYPLVVRNDGDAPLTISRVVFNNINLSVEEPLPVTIPVGGQQTLTVVYNSIEEKDFDAIMQIYSNDPDQRVYSIQVIGNRYAPNFLQVVVPTVPSGEDLLKVQLNIDNYDAISGMQFDVVYPSQYYAPADEHVVLGPLANGMTVTSREIDSQTMRYFCYFLDGSHIGRGTGELLTLQFAPLTNVPLGSYDVQVKNISLGTGELANKNATDDQTVSFTVGGSPVTIRVNNASRQYGDANPEFTYTVEGGTLIGQPEITCAATATSPVGTYDIIVSQGTVSNYNVTYVAGTLTIEAAPLTITAGTYTKKQGEEMPEFTLTYTGFKNDENESVLTVQPTVTTTATIDCEPGDYPVYVSGAEAQNYTISYVDGILTITMLTGNNTLKVNERTFDVYTTSGVLVRSRATTLKGLSKGIYVVNGRRAVVSCTELTTKREIFGY